MLSQLQLLPFLASLIEAVLLYTFNTVLYYNKLCNVMIIFGIRITRQCVCVIFLENIATFLYSIITIQSLYSISISKCVCVCGVFTYGGMWVENASVF